MGLMFLSSTAKPKTAHQLIIVTFVLCDVRNDIYSVALTLTINLYLLSHMIKEIEIVIVIFYIYFSIEASMK